MRVGMHVRTILEIINLAQYFITIQYEILGMAVQHQLPIFSENRYFDFMDGLIRIEWRNK